MLGAAAIVIFGVAFTATHLNLSRFDNELRFRGQAHNDLTAVLSDPKVKAGLRCGPLTGPNHKIVPDARWIADLRRRLGAGARAESYRDDRNVPLPTKGVAIVVTSRFAIFKHAWTDASRRRAASRSRRPASSASRRRGSTPRMSAAEPPRVAAAGSLAGDARRALRSPR